MSQDNRQILWSKEDHPSTELLRQYQQDALPPTLNHRLEEHLLDCELCSDVMEGMVLSGAPETKAAVRHINRLVSSKVKKKAKRKVLPLYMLDWRVAAAVLLVMCSMVLVLYYNYREINLGRERMASESDKAIQEAMDLAEAPAATGTETLTDAVPDTLKPAVVATTPPVPFKRRKRSATAQKEQETTVPATELATEPDDAIADINFSTDTPAIAAAPAKAAKAETIILQKNTFVADSTSVARAMEGKLEGLKIRGTSSLSVNQLQGQVLSPTGQPLPGVAVTIKGTNRGVATDAQGNFTLNIPQQEATLVFNYIGFNREEKAVRAGTTDLKVNLSENTQALSEVVVTRVRGVSDSQPPAKVIISARPAEGRSAYRKYLRENIRYTSDSEKGRVEVLATVSPTGALQNLRISKKLCPSCDKEALRLVKEGPAWKAATMDGVPVEQEVKIVVRFKP